MTVLYRILLAVWLKFVRLVTPPTWR